MKDRDEGGSSSWDRTTENHKKGIDALCEQTGGPLSSYLLTLLSYAANSQYTKIENEMN